MRLVLFPGHFAPYCFLLQNAYLVIEMAYSTVHVHYSNFIQVQLHSLHTQLIQPPMTLVLQARSGSRDYHYLCSVLHIYTWVHCPCEPVLPRILITYKKQVTHQSSHSTFFIHKRLSDTYLGTDSDCYPKCPVVVPYLSVTRLVHLGGRRESTWRTCAVSAHSNA